MEFHILTLMVFVISREKLTESSKIVNLVFMRIPYQEKLLTVYLEAITNVKSVHQCVEYCRDYCICKSVGIDTSSMTCYLYDGRVYAGLPGTVNTDIIYYWQLEAECPIHLGYSEDFTSKICSKYNATGITWVEAQKQCQTENGILMSVDTQEKITLIDHYASITASGTKLFLGATDMEDEDTWNWFSGVPIDRSKFRAGQPNNLEGLQHCVIYRNEAKSGYDDTKCDDDFYLYGFICEVPTRIAYNT